MVARTSLRTNKQEFISLCLQKKHNMALGKSFHIAVVLLPLQLLNGNNFSLQDRKKNNENTVISTINR